MNPWRRSDVHSPGYEVAREEQGRLKKKRKRRAEMTSIPSVIEFKAKARIGNLALSLERSPPTKKLGVQVMSWLVKHPLGLP